MPAALQGETRCSVGRKGSHEAMVQMLDDLVGLCRQVGLRLLLTPFDTFFTWNNWDRHPYNRANGGPCDSRERLLTCPATRACIKHRLTFASQRIGKPVSQPRIDDLGVTPTLIAHHGRTRHQKTQGAGPACRAGSGLSISHSETTGQSLST